MKQRLQFVGGEVSYKLLNRIQHEINRGMLPPFLRRMQGAKLKSIYYASPELITMRFNNGFQFRVLRLDVDYPAGIVTQRRRDEAMIGATVEAIWFFDRSQLVIEFTGGHRMVCALTS